MCYVVISNISINRNPCRLKSARVFYWKIRFENMREYGKNGEMHRKDLINGECSIKVMRWTVNPRKRDRYPSPAPNLRRIMKDMERKEIRVELGEVDSSCFAGTIDGAIDRLMALKEKHSDCSILDISFDVGYGYYDSTFVRVSLSGIRMETDVEFQKRINDLKKAKEAAKKRKITMSQRQEEKDRKEFERLKAKYK
jgi:hypothetical protein